MARIHRDWLSSFLDYTKYGEAPMHMYFWAGVSAIAGALQRKVWIDQAYFKWFPNFYIVLVAPPGIVSKSTTAGLSMELLRQVPGVQFGPDVVTWPALVSAFAKSTVGFEHQGLIWPMSSLTLESSEFGNLLNPQDKQMVDLLVSLWDGKQGNFEKSTKHSGNDTVENPWINLIACTTPSWIAGNFPEYMVGGGFTSRTIFVYAEEKRQFSAYPGLEVPLGIAEQKLALIADLTEISKLTGEYKLATDTVAWGRAWYERHYKQRPINMDPERFGGYIARKQTHIHKLAMVLAASESDELIIQPEHLKNADDMITDLEPDMQFVFSKIGRSDSSLHAERLVKFITERGEVNFQEAYRYVHGHFHSMRDFEDVMSGLMRAGYVISTSKTGGIFLSAGVPLPTAVNGKTKL